jgi:DNA polymerase-3 subunit epsilon
MNWLDALRDAFGGGSGPLSPDQRLRLDAWRRLPAVDLEADHMATRYVIVDVEASGLDAEKDRLISIGAVALNGGLIDPLDAFEVVLRQDEVSTTENILVHGIGGSAQREGIEPAEALLDFLEFAGKAPLIAYHTFFDQAMIERAARAALGFRPPFVWIDLAWILPEMFAGRQDTVSGLENWLDIFGIPNFRRHNAVADCYATAQLMQIVLRRARAFEAGSPSRLMLLEKSRRWLRHA